MTRQKDNAAYAILGEFELDDSTTDAVLKDERILVEKDGRAIELRRIAYWDAQNQKCYVFLSNNFLISPDRIANIYKHRWQIETMFKRLKQNFPLKYFLGDNQNAIEIQIWCGLIIQLLMLVVQRRTKRRWSYSNMVSMVRFHLMTYIDLFKFLENPDQTWEHLTTKPPEKQLSLF
ncbi:MAG: transposase [Bacteroidota bacterium]